ncbi:sodium/potassium/calcium exchanger 1 [Leucoraja erinacea]|uniref:sodium/potassium/calcium exchanger 1 n=1 Tax=Leucoraja erinaceus TaxID=7782 RepID=UPI002454E093|nr:sodium/potassium/calcium exchanger 1 [Leucoraja erinacea]
MFPGRRRRLSWSRVVFLLAALTICSLSRFPTGSWPGSTLWGAGAGGASFPYSRKLLQVTTSGSAHTQLPGTRNPHPRLTGARSPDPGLPTTSSPDPGLPTTSSPDPGLPTTSSPDPGLPTTSSPDPGLARTRSAHPETPSPHPGPHGSSTPNPGLTGAKSPRPGVLGPNNPLTRDSNNWPPPNQTSAAAISSEPAPSGKPRLRGCILVGNEIVPVPAPTVAASTPGSSEAPAGSVEPPPGHIRSAYPVDVFSLEERRQGWVLLHVTGMVYMFIALALVCDEFFVPSLGAIIERLKISDDVAGATFMAAGGSAPELFTALIGVFISHSNVGIGTIVGSAVFNILFVIGMCAIFSREILYLSWWPLFRDVSFYIVDLLMLIVFFLDNMICWWESLCLLLAYLAYVGFMKYNSEIEQWFKRQITNNSNVVKVMSLLHGVKKNTDIDLKDEEPSDNTRLKETLAPGCSTPSLHNSTLRSTIFQLMINTLDPLTEVKFMQKAEVMNNMANGNGGPKEERQTKMKDGETEERTDLPNTVNVPTDPPATSPPETNDDANTNQDPKESDSKGEDDGGQGGDGSSDGNDDDESDDSDEDSDDEDEEDEEESDAEEPLSLEWPETRRKQVTYLCLLPIVFPLWLTVPDVRNPASKKYFFGTFIGSILWIGAFSYLMVYLAHQVGETIGISEEIMGLTILAAGTSIPDLITSVIVARKGLGDMAVSSSVGSNIFDITVG